MTKRKVKGNNGQIALIVLLISAVILTLGLSISRKTVVETRIDTDEELLKQAFNAAESGVEYYLSTGNTTYTMEDGSVATVQSDSIAEGETVVDFDEVTLQNQNTVFWLAPHNTDGTVITGGADAYMGSSVNLCVYESFNGALKVDYFYHDGTYKVKRWGYNIGSDFQVNGFSNVTTGSCTGKPGMKQITITELEVGDGLMLAVTPLGANTKFVLQSPDANDFPSQGEEITGLGSVADETQSSAGTVTSRVKVFNVYKIPSFMLDAVTSLSSIN